MRAIATLLIAASIASAQTAYWDGKVYTPQNFPTALTHNCPMCVSLRVQWAEWERWEALRLQQAASDTRTTSIAATTQRSQEFDIEYELKTMQKQVKRCARGRPCWYETVNVQQWVPVYVPRQVMPIVQPAPKPIIKEPPKPDPLTTTELHSTPQAAIDALFALLPAGDGKLFMDLGCGDGRLLAAAVAHGYLAIGIELDDKRADAARKRLAGTPAIVFSGDVRDFDLGGADVIYMWLFPQLMGELDLPASARIISYHHEIPDSHKVTIAHEPFYIRQPR